MTKWRPTDGNTVKYREFMSSPIESLTEVKGEMGKTYLVTKGDVWTVIPT